MVDSELQQTTDEELMAQFIETSDEQIFHQLMKRHHSMAIGFVQKKVFNHSLAQEIVQDSFVKVVRNKKQFNTSMKFTAWFYSIVKNCCIDAVRQRQRHQNKLAKISENLDLFTKNDESTDHDITAMLKTISEQDRTILVQHFIHGHTFIELADKLGHSKEALKKRAQRAIKKIRNSLTK